MTGPAAIASCPSNDELACFQRGETPSSRIEELAEHLETCSVCQSSLASLSFAADDLLDELRRVRDLDRPDEVSLIGEMAALESDSGTIFGDTQKFRATVLDTRELPLRWGEYSLLELIGRGGMGTVYRAVHNRLDKVVAIKVLAPSRLGDAGSLARFERELKAIGKLNHPNIVLATDAGEVDGAPFLVMEYVEGIDLARLVKQRGRLDAAEACEIVRQAAIGLQCAHMRGLVHRDLKPSNLLLTLAPDQPAGGVVKIADLGLALLREQESGVESASSANLVIGSLDYMAPEQADNAHQVDQRADLYSLGCTLYELLAGKPPFASPGQSRIQKLKAHASTAAPSLMSVCSKLPSGLDQLVRKLLAKNPADRFASADELAVALQPFASGANLARLLDSAAPSHSSVGLPSSAAPPARKQWTRGLLGSFMALVFAGVVYVQTDRGTLEIKSDDDEVKVRVEQDGKLITLVDLKANKEIRLRSGSYDVALGDADQDLALDADEFTLRRGDKRVLHIRRQPPTLLGAPFDADEAKRHQERWARFRGVPVTVKNPSGMTLALIPPGKFEMRSGYHVTITKPYYLASHEVTLAQFRQFAEATGHKSALEQEGRGIIDLGTFKEAPGLNWRNPAMAASDDHPVAGVTWHDAERFCAWLSEREKRKYRLPTEAEWEWAARVGSMAMFAWGDEWEGGDDREWSNRNSEGHSHPVGQKLPNAWGLFDINGNVVEWCADWHLNPFPQGEVSDPMGPTQSAGAKLLRGGSFQEAPAPYTNRGSFGPASSMYHCGFRICREL